MNVADIFLCLGGALLIFYIIFFLKKDEKQI